MELRALSNKASIKNTLQASPTSIDDRGGAYERYLRPLRPYKLTLQVEEPFDSRRTL